MSPVAPVENRPQHCKETIMDRFAFRLAAAALLASLVACATPPRGSAGRPTPENFAQIVVGKTTANQVRELLGSPARTLKSRTHDGEDWGFEYAGAFGPRMFWIEISPDGIARGTSDSVDFDTDLRYRGG